LKIKLEVEEACEKRSRMQMHKKRVHCYFIYTYISRSKGSPCRHVFTFPPKKRSK